MKKRALLAVPMALMAMSAMSQVQLTSGDLMQLNGLIAPVENQGALRMKKAAQRERVDMIIRYDSEKALKEIEAKGGVIRRLVGTRTAIVSVDAFDAVAVAGSTGVRGAQVSTKMNRDNNFARAMSYVDEVRKGSDKLLEQGYDGDGVIVAVYDIGMDPNHINFRDEDGNTRVQRMWFYPNETVDSEYYDSPEKVADFRSDTTEESHGTHVMGIMTGSFHDADDKSAADLRGVAPGAELICACGEGWNAQILDAVENFGKYAQERGKRCVVNLSFGDNVGPHDGSDTFPEALNDIAEKYNLVICMAGGNEREYPISFIKKCTEDDCEINTLLLKGVYQMQNPSFQTFGMIEVWSEDDTPVEVSLECISRTDPENPLYTFEIPEDKEGYVSEGTMLSSYFDPKNIDVIEEGTEFQNIYGESFMGGVRGLDTYNNRYRARMNVYLVGKNSTTVSRNFVKLHIKGQPGKKVYVYANYQYMSFGTRGIAGLDEPDGNGTNSNMACGKSTIAVGSYVSSNVTDSGYEWGVVGEPSYFSSYGETADGRVMPHISTPGQVIISSRNSYMPTTQAYQYQYPLHYQYTDQVKRKSYYWTSCAGTSQASPHMAGICALWLQANPELDVHDILDLAAKTATKTETGIGWGHGRVDALAGIKGALGFNSVYDIIENTPVSIVIEGDARTGYDIYAPGQESVEVSLVSLQGVTVKKTACAGDSMHMDVAGVDAGIYVMQVKGSHSTRSVKVAL